MKLRNTFIKLLFIFVLCNLSFAQQSDKRLKLWYNQPAKQWVEALPIGNGRIAAMIFGNPSKEKLQLNESTFWSGGPSRNDNPDGVNELNPVRYYIFEKK